MTDDHSLVKYDSLIANFEYSKRNFVLARKIGNEYQLVDGVHRAAILKQRGVNFIEVVLPVGDMSWF